MNPYAGKPDHQFWRSMVGDVLVDPVTEVPFRLSVSDPIATAGSCFAQHISRTLVAKGYNYLVTEPEPLGGGESYGVFPARFGNIYTVRQLLQTFDRAYALFVPSESIWRRGGSFIDPFRPEIQRAGFPSELSLGEDRRGHLKSVRRMFEDCSVLIFTLGLTEAWRSTRDGAVVPLPPGAAKCKADEDYEFHNFSVAEQTADLRRFLDKLRAVNPTVRVILTVSPVSLKATYESRHVLVSNTYSKAVLRVVAEEVARAEPDVLYFPSYEIITAAGHTFLSHDRRSVTQAGVDHVMSVFTRHLLDGEPVSKPTVATIPVLSAQDLVKFQEEANVLCEEDALDPAHAA